MGKMQAVIVSGLLLMPAGGLLAYVMIMMFMNHAGDAKVMLQITAGLASLCGVTAALMPVAILLFMPAAGSKAVSKSSMSSSSDSSKSGNNASNFSDDVAPGMESEETVINSAAEFDGAASEDFETMDFDSNSMDEEAVDDFDNFEFEEEEEIKPKKKKKK